MILPYRVHLSNGENQIYKCDSFQLKKKVAEKLNNLPIDQIVLIDKDNKLFNPNITLTQTQMINPNIEQMYQQVDLQKLIMEWITSKNKNHKYQKTIEENLNQINELNNQIQEHKKENQTESQKNNNTIIQLQNDLEKQTQQYSQERKQLQKTIQDLQSQLVVNANQYEQQQQQFQNTLQDLNEKLKIAEDKIQKCGANIQQLNAQIQEKDNTIQNITSQCQQLYSQLQQWQQGYGALQQQATQQNQVNEQSIKELTEEKELIDKKLKAEKVKITTLTDSITNLESQLTTEQTQNKKQETMIKRLQQQIQDNKQELENIESEKNRAAQVGWNVNQEVQKLKQEISKLRNENSQLQLERDQLQIDLDTYKQQHVVLMNQAQMALQTANTEHEEEVKGLNNKINQLCTEISNQKKLYSDALYQIKDREAKIEQTKQENQKLQLNLDQLSSNGNSLGQQKKNLEQTAQQLQNELNEAKKLYEVEKAKYRTAENEKTQLKGELQQKDIELTSEKTNHDATQKEKSMYQEQCKKMGDSFKELQQQSTNEVQRLTIQVQVAEKKIERVLQNCGETKLLEKITGPLEKIMASEYKINKFTEDPNSQSDNAQYNLIEIGLQFDKFTQYVKEGKFFLIDECFQYGNKINITATRSIQANAESEFYKGYLIKIIESAQADLKTKTLLRKDLKLQNLAFQNKEEAARLAVNNIFCLWLQIQFNKDLGTAKLQTQKQTIQRQFIIENEAKKEFYYCEMVEEGPFQKINGGKFVPQKDDIHQYFNGLSIYSYKMFEQQMILTNFQVCGNYVYDMIVHTNHKGLFSPLDQGSHESITFTEILSKQPAEIMSKSWNEVIKSLAEKYLRG